MKSIKLLSASLIMAAVCGLSASAAEMPTQQGNEMTMESSYGKTSYNPFLWLSQRYATYNDLAYLSQYDLRILRNAIYARHGYKFKSPDLREYFSQFSWYHPRYNNVKLTKIEQANVEYIKSFEY